MKFRAVIGSFVPPLHRGVGRGLLGWGLLLGSAGAVRATTAEQEGWQDLAGYLFHDAHEVFTREPAEGDRLRALGAAASLLNDPPVTSGKVERAEAQLRQLVKDNGTDEPAIYARYLIARIAHLHRSAEVPEIEADYWAVITAAPKHPLAQLAAGKLALVLLYQRPDLSVAQRLSAAGELAPLAGNAQLPETACAYYRVLAEAAMYYDVLDERVLGWLQQADTMGSRDIMTAMSLRVQLAEVARALGHRDEAIAYYRQYLAVAGPTDNRYRTAKDRMMELEKAAR
ncbi:MAG: hypothetical protein ABI222_07450 [Opitutaceae bacterium]